MKNYFIKTVLFLMALFVPTILWLGLSIFSPVTYEKLKFDTGEKREMTTITKDDNVLTDGTAISDFVADRAPFRSILLSFYKSADQKIESVYLNGIKPVLTKAFFKQEATGVSKEVSNDAYEQLFGTTQQETPAIEPETTPSQESKDPENDEEEHDFVLINEIPATCSSVGVKTYECTICQDSYDEIIEQLPHNLLLTADVQASYENYGHKDYYCVDCGYVETRDWVDKFIDDSFMAPSTMGDVILGRSNWLFYSGLGTLDYYRGTNIMSAEEMEEYTIKLQEFNKLCKSKGIQLAVLIAPAKEQVYSEYMPTYSIENTYKRVARLADYIKANTDIAFSYPITELQYAGRYWQDYSKYDTHWNRIGAYIGTMSMYSTLGMETINPNTLSIRRVDSINPGDLFALGGIDGSVFASDDDFFVPYKSEVNVTYRNDEDFMNAPIYYATSDSLNKKKVVMIGDSYRTLMIPYLEKDFSTTIVCHKDVLEEFEPYMSDTDVLILMAAERNDMDILKDIEIITEWLNK